MQKISVIMGIYNCEETLSEAIECILAQTYSNWELILCDDGSKDNTYDVANEYKKNYPDKIILIRNEKNSGLNYTLNHCLKYATGEFVARMDGDDRCVPERFEKQVNFLQQHGEFDIVSSTMKMFDENGEWGETTAIECPMPGDVVATSPICHAPVMMRKECMDAVNGYTVDKRMLRVEDVNLWIKLYAAGFRCYNIQEPLYCMRNDQNALNRRKYRYRINSTYVRLKGCRMLKLPAVYYIKAFNPMIVGLVPAKIRQIIRKKQRGN